MLKNLWEKASIWAKALEGIDDPRGEYTLWLEGRGRNLEHDVAGLALRLDQLVASTPTKNE